MTARSPGDDAAARALAKLERVLPASLRRRAAATRRAVEVTDPVGEPMVLGDVGLVVDTVADDGRVRFGYTDLHGRCSTRLVDPYRHVLRAGHAYLVGWDVERDDWRVFRFDRVTDVERVPGRFARRAFPAESVAAWFATDLGRA